MQKALFTCLVHTKIVYYINTVGDETKIKVVDFGNAIHWVHREVHVISIIW